ncbi:DUF2971 domain-containing protein [Enterobacter mori]|uniref:DUF2971 domain-containing protein n=1 Tax=Enterobacter mori TaxID=539813 RepID=UPI0032AF701B
MYFYKYQRMSALNVSMLRHGEVFFASPKELNDIHECKPQFIFSADAETWSRFIDKILLTLCMELELRPEDESAKSILSLNKKILSPILKGRKSRSINHQDLNNILGPIFSRAIISNINFKDAVAALKAFDYYMRKQLNDELNDNYYISSFSKSAKNLTMWGHYGDAEKGYAIIYETVDGNVKIESSLSLFTNCCQDDDGITRFNSSCSTTTKIMSLDYKSKPVRANGFTRLIHHFNYIDQEEHYDLSQELLSRLNNFSEENIGWVKYTDWKYEKELRLHLPIYEEIPSSLRSIRISGKHIKGVIFGSRTSSEDKQNILSALYQLKKSQKEDCEIYAFQANPIPNLYKINVTILGRVINPEGRFIEKLESKHLNLKKEAMKIAEAINLS